MEDHTGKLICIDATCITVSRDDGSHHTRSVSAATKFTLDGDDATADDLQPGDDVTVAGDPVTLVSVTRE